MVELADLQKSHVSFYLTVKQASCMTRNAWQLQNRFNCKYRVSQEECEILRESVPYVKLYRYNPKHLYPKLNGYGDNGQRSLKLWHLLHTYWLPNTCWNWQEYVVSVMLISVLNIKVTCDIKTLNWTTKTLELMRQFFRVPRTLHCACISSSNEVLSYRVGRSSCAVKLANVRSATQSDDYWEGWLHCTLKVNGLTAVEVQYAEMQDVHNFLWPLSP